MRSSMKALLAIGLLAVAGAGCADINLNGKDKTDAGDPRSRQIDKLVIDTRANDPNVRAAAAAELGNMNAQEKDSLDELLSKEKKRVSEFERKFEVTAELEKKKLEKAEEKFAKAMGEAEKEE